jgi:hypothetical protein
MAAKKRRAAMKKTTRKALRAASVVFLDVAGAFSRLQKQLRKRGLKLVKERKTSKGTWYKVAHAIKRPAR